MSRETTAPERVRTVLESFVDELSSNLDGDPQTVEDVLDKGRVLTQNDLDATPEKWTEDALIDELIDAVGLEAAPGRPTPRFDLPDWNDPQIPDFELQEDQIDGVWVIGENKPVNKIDEAKEDIEDYLSYSWWPNNGIATDGIEWVLYHIGKTTDDSRDNRSFKKEIDLRSAVRGIAVERGHISGTSEDDLIDEKIREFVDSLQPDSVATTFGHEAPQTLRDEREEEVDEFFNLYLDLVFGGKDKDGTDKYDSCLKEDVIAPESADDEDKNIFAVTLVNRLLFVKFLEERGVLNEGFLLNRMEDYNSDLPESLYKTVFDPLFYELLNTPKPRKETLQGDWRDDVPYLNGGLFRPNVENEREFDVATRTLPKIITDLIERGEIDFDLDPSILGSVFERTVNIISESDTDDIDYRNKKGAYYTPDDVTRLVSERTVRPKLREEIVEAFAEVVTKEAEYRAEVDGMPLDEILVKIEDGVSYFGRTEGIDRAIENIRELSVLDPACGSGHFLTTTFDELHRVQLSLLRGKYGNSLDEKKKFRAKKELALNTLYGVDVERMACEIAKLRIWLKIVEDGWEEDFGRLPNIDMNIAVGNSLVGQPITGQRLTSFDTPDVKERVREALQRRLEYRHNDKGDKETAEGVLDDDLRPVMDEAYVDSLNYFVEDEVKDAESLDAIVGSLDEEDKIEEVVREVRVKRSDAESFTESQEEALSQRGFTVYKVSATLELRERAKTLRLQGVEEVDERLIGELRELLTDGLEFVEFQRQPLAIDYENIQSEPFHWPIEFPELMVDGSFTDGNLDLNNLEVDPSDAKFDLILGNPPYGNITSSGEENLTNTYEMSGSDIAALFVERQLHLLDEDGYFGNVTTLKLAYKSEMVEIQDVLREELETTTVSCFGKRPSKVFQDAEVRVAIMTGKANDGKEKGTIETSEFIRFDNKEDREQRFQDIEHRPIEDLVLYESGIDGRGSHIAIPKVGRKEIREILETLRSQESIIRYREKESESPHAIWRREGMDYFTNPMMEELYDAREVKPFYFDSELEARAAFLAISSSIFYVYWCVYGDMFHLNLGEIRSFPFPKKETIEENRDEIMNLSDELWEKMEEGFNVNPEDSQFHNYPEQKPIIENVDELFGDMYGIDDEAVQFAKHYHEEYGRHGPDRN